MSNQIFENNHVLIIGVGHDLPCSVNDAEKLYDLFVDEKRGGYPKGQVKKITQEDTKKVDIIGALEELANNTTEQSTVIIYYAGHGGRVKEGDEYNHYLCPYDYVQSNDKDKLLSRVEFGGLVNNIKAGKMMLIFDCCHANYERTLDLDYDADNLQDFVEGGERIVIASCSANQKSYSDSTRNHGIFTSVLLEALEGRGTKNGKGFISYNDISEYLIEHVPFRATYEGRIPSQKQNPVFNIKNYQGFKICKNYYKKYIFVICDKDCHDIVELMKKLEQMKGEDAYEIRHNQQDIVTLEELYQEIDLANMVYGIGREEDFSRDCAALYTYAKDKHKRVSLIDRQNWATTLLPYPKNSISTDLAKGLLKLNYDIQRHMYRQIFRPEYLKHINILLIQGTPFCGQRLLVEIFLKHYKSEYQDDKQLIKLEGKDFVPNTSWIWEAIALRFGLSFNSESKIIMSKMAEYLNKKNIYIIFNNIQDIAPLELPKLSDFWDELYHKLDDLRSKPNYRIFIFAIDQSGQTNNYYKKDYFLKAHKGDLYNSLCILEPIKCLGLKEIENWLLHIEHDHIEIWEKLDSNNILNGLNEIQVTKGVSNMIDTLSNKYPELTNKKLEFLQKIQTYSNG